MLDLLIITTLICILTLWIQSKPFFWKGKGIDWKIPLPIVGNTGIVLYQPWHVFWVRFWNSLGNKRMCGFHYFSTPALLIKDPELLKRVTISDSDHFMDRELFSAEYDHVGKSLFFTANQTWKNQRVKMTPYFTPSKIKTMIQFIHPITDRFVRYIEEEAEKGPVDVQDSSLKFTTDVITSNVFGLQPDAFDNKNSFFYGLQKEMLSFGLGFRAMIGILAPTLYKILRLRFFSKSTSDKLTNFVNDVIAQRSKGIGVRPDIMQGMIELMNKENSANGISNKIHVSEFDKPTVVGQSMLMYVAGTETTGNALSFLMYELALNQNIQNRLRKEIDSMLVKTSGNYALDDLNRLSYLDMVISETLRKYPIATVVGRKCTKPYNIEGLDIPVGTIVMLPIVAIHQDPNHYEEPMKFDPERFGSNSNITPGAYLPFGLGPRTCIGMKFATAEISLALVKLLPKYRLTPSHLTTVPIIFSTNPTLSSKTPIMLNIEPVG